MYAVRLFVFLGLVVSSLSLHAQAFQASPSEKQAVLIYEEDGITTVDQLARAADGWPEIVQRNRFHEPTQLKNFLRKNFPKRIPGAFAAGEALKSAGTPLWKVTNQWNWAFEVELANWIRTDVDKDFFVRHGIATDCADVAYALRWIFARAHGLPMTSRLASGDWMNQDSMRPAWLKLPTANEWYDDKRFLAALDYLLDFTFTHTLLADSYPTAVNLNSVMEGGYHLVTHDNTGHTRPFTKVLRPGETGIPIYILQSTTPRSVQELFGDGYWVQDVPVKGQSGLLRFRWPDGTGKGLIAADHMPNYSEEQYDPAFTESGELFYVAVFRHLDPSFTMDKLATEFLKSTQNSVLFRKQIVEDGFAFCSVNDCSEGSPGYEAWSTPSRDLRLKQMLAQLNQLMNMVPSDIRTMLENAMLDPLLKLDNVDYNLRAILWSWANNTYSVDPRVSKSARWGLSGESVDAFLRQKSTELWQTREAFIATTSSCPANICIPHSAAWNDRSTRELDNKLAKLLSLSTDYCADAPATECAEFKRRLNLPFALRLGGMSLQQTLESFLGINNDPRHTVQVRREGLGPAPFYVGQGASLRSTANFLAARDDGSSGVRIWDIRKTRTEIPPPAGMQWLMPALVSNRAWFESNQGVGVRDLIKGTENRVSLSFEPDAAATSNQGSAFFWNSTRFAFVNADGKLVREGAADAVRALDKDHVFVIVGGQNYLYTLEAQDYKTVSTSYVPNGESMGLSNSLGWFFANDHTTLLKKDGTTTDFPTASYPVLVEADGQTLYAYGKNSHLLKLHLDKDGSLISTESYDDFSVEYSSKTFISLRTGGNNDFIFLENGKFKSARLMANEERLLDMQGDLVIGQTQNEMFVRRLSNPTHIFSVKGELRFIGGKPGLVRVCDSNVPGGFFGQFSNCRIEDIFNPASFSLYTGLPSFEFSMFSGLASVSTASPLERGIKVSIDTSTTWVDL